MRSKSWICNLYFDNWPLWWTFWWQWL